MCLGQKKKKFVCVLKCGPMCKNLRKKLWPWEKGWFFFLALVGFLCLYYWHNQGPPLVWVSKRDSHKKGSSSCPGLETWFKGPWAVKDNRASLALTFLYRESPGGGDPCPLSAHIPPHRRKQTQVTRRTLPRRVRNVPFQDCPGGPQLGIQFLRQQTQVPGLVREQHTCCGATKPVCHSRWSPCL